MFQYRNSRRTRNSRANNFSHDNNNFSHDSNRKKSGVGGKKRGIFNPAHLAQFSESLIQREEYVVKNQFVDFGFCEVLEKNILDKKYTTPTPIQDQVINHILENRDVIGLASTGTGKTAAFLLPLIQKIYTQDDGRVLIIAPTRELAVQIREELSSFTQNMKVVSALCIGGVPMDRQLKTLRRKPSFVIGTPGRIIDFEKRAVINFNSFSHIVLDEVDQMFDMGFINDMEYIIDKLPQERQSLFFSATLSSKMSSIVKKFLREPVVVEVQKSEDFASIEQRVVKVGKKTKIDVLCELLQNKELAKVLVFGRTKRGLNKLLTQLDRRGVGAVIIHGNKSQAQRRSALDNFKKNKTRVLLATDIASRGLDIDDVTHVVNYDLPATQEDYVHRIGRTGRAKKTGVAISFVD